MGKEDHPGRRVTEREARWAAQEAFGPGLNYLRAERSARQVVPSVEILQPAPEVIVDEEELAHKGNVINGWWTLTHPFPEDPTDYEGIKTHVSSLLRELRINVKRYPYADSRAVLMEAHFRTAVDPILYLGIVGHRREPIDETSFLNPWRTWNQRRTAAASKGYGVLSFQDYAEELKKGDLYRQFVGKNKP